jgi:hypothetical protein
MLDGFGFVKGTGFNLYYVVLKEGNMFQQQPFTKVRKQPTTSHKVISFPRGKKIMVFKPIWDKSLDGVDGLT